MIVTDKDKVFTSIFWKEKSKALGTKLDMSTANHPQTDGQTEQVNQCLELFLRSFIFNRPQKWCGCLSLAEW
jgi:hypothetical protein